MSGMSIMALIVLAMLIAFLLGVLFMWLWRRCCADDHHGADAHGSHDAWRTRLTAAEGHQEQLRRTVSAREGEIAQLKAQLATQATAATSASAAIPAAGLMTANAESNAAAADEANVLRARLAMTENELRRLRAANAALSANMASPSANAAVAPAAAVVAAPAAMTGTIKTNTDAVNAPAVPLSTDGAAPLVSTASGPAKTGRWVGGKWVFGDDHGSHSGTTQTTAAAGQGRWVNGQWVFDGADAGGAAALVDAESLQLAGAADADADQVIDAVLGSDQTAEETEGWNLIQSGNFVATAANKPKSLLTSASNGPADDLELIKGVGPKLGKMLNDLGIYYFDQVGSFSASDIAWVNSNLTDFKGRIVRDRWVPQGKIFAARKRAGHMVVGKKGLWTLAAATAGDAASKAAIAALPVSAAEEEALRLMDAGFEATDANRPASLLSARPAQIDDLKDIKGVAEKLEALLHSLGVYTFKQVANFSAKDIAWVDTKLKFKGRIVRDRWVAQSRALHKARHGTEA